MSKEKLRKAVIYLRNVLMYEDLEPGGAKSIHDSINLIQESDAEIQNAESHPTPPSDLEGVKKILKDKFSNMLDRGYAGAEFTEELSSRIDDCATVIAPLIGKREWDKRKLQEIIAQNLEWTDQYCSKAHIDLENLSQAIIKSFSPPCNVERVLRETLQETVTLCHDLMSLTYPINKPPKWKADTLKKAEAFLKQSLTGQREFTKEEREQINKQRKKDFKRVKVAPQDKGIRECYEYMKDEKRGYENYPQTDLEIKLANAIKNYCKGK